MSYSSLIDKYCVVKGLQSDSGKVFNGQVGLVVNVDVNDVNRYGVLLSHPNGGQSSLISIKSQNLEPVFSVEVRNSSLGGKGLFASKKFAVGDIIFEEKPLLIATRFEEVEDRVQLLSESERLSLSYLTVVSQDNAPVEWRGSEWARRFANNCIVCDGLEMALYPIMCRINHSCCFTEFHNVRWAWDKERRVQYLTASKAIKESDELVTDYISDTVWGADRVANLEAHGISGCRCVACVPGPLARLKMNEYLEAKRLLTTSQITWQVTNISDWGSIVSQGVEALNQLELSGNFAVQPGSTGPLSNLKSYLYFNFIQMLLRARKYSPDPRLVVDLTAAMRDAVKKMHAMRLGVVGDNECHPYMNLTKQLMKAIDP